MLLVSGYVTNRVLRYNNFTGQFLGALDPATPPASAVPLARPSGPTATCTSPASGTTGCCATTPSPEPSWASSSRPAAAASAAHSASLSGPRQPLRRQQQHPTGAARRRPDGRLPGRVLNRPGQPRPGLRARRRPVHRLVLRRRLPLRRHDGGDPRPLRQYRGLSGGRGLRVRRNLYTENTNTNLVHALQRHDRRPAGHNRVGPRLGRP